jgi:hypothetical protein
MRQYCLLRTVISGQLLEKLTGASLTSEWSSPDRPAGPARPVLTPIPELPAVSSEASLTEMFFIGDESMGESITMRNRSGRSADGERDWLASNRVIKPHRHHGSGLTSS